MSRLLEVIIRVIYTRITDVHENKKDTDEKPLGFR